MLRHTIKIHNNRHSEVFFYYCEKYQSQSATIFVESYKLLPRALKEISVTDVSTRFSSAMGAKLFL
jgi:hypothetical protein